MTVTRAAVYIRVSTDRQAAEGESLEMQLARAKEIADARGWQLLPEYMDVMTGKRDSRPALAQMEKALKAGEIDAVICYKVDRLGRSRRKMHELLELIQQRNIKLVSLTQQIDTTTASGRLMLSVLVDFAVYEVEQSGERISDTLLHIAKQGRHPTGSVPYGYSYEPLRRENDEMGREVKAGGHLIIDESEAEGVRFAFDIYRRVGSLSGTAIALNKAGYRTRTGKMWKPEGVRLLLTNPLYGGERALRKWRNKAGARQNSSSVLRQMPDWDLVPADHEPIIPVEIAREVREQYWKSRLTSPRSRAANSPWTGLIVCSHCGEKFRHVPQMTSSPVYRCPGKMYGVCDVLSIPEAWLNHEVINGISQAIDKAKGIQKVTEVPQAKRQEIPLTRNKDRQITSIKRKLDRLELRFDNEIIDGDTYLRERKAILAELESIQAFEEKPKQTAGPILPDSLAEVWPKLLDTPEGIEIARRLLQSIVFRIIIDPDGGLIEFQSLDGLELPREIRIQRWPKYARYARIMHWSKNHNACVECGTTEKRHVAKGLCIECYNRRKRQREKKEKQTMGWSTSFACCVDCGTKERPHFAKGRCNACYNRYRREQIKLYISRH